MSLKDMDLLRERIMRNVTIDHDTGCWIWDRSVVNTGYGQLMVREGSKSRKLLVHRASYLAFVGDIPDGHVIAHSCDRKRCCAPYHLRADTQSNNMKEAVAKGRMKNPNPPKPLTRSGVLFE